MTGMVRSLFGSSPTIQPPSTTNVDYESANMAADLERRRQRAAGGRASTLLTSGRGLSNSANIGTTSLLGK